MAFVNLEAENYKCKERKRENLEEMNSMANATRESLFQVIYLIHFLTCYGA